MSGALILLLIVAAALLAYWLGLNPLVGLIDGFRWCILGGDSPLYLSGFLLSLAIIVFSLYSGVTRFRKMEKTFADLI